MLTFEQLLRKEEYQKGIDKGRDEGRDEGIVRGQRELLLRQLTRRFGSLPAAVTERVARGSLQDLELWSDRILDAASLDDIFASP